MNDILKKHRVIGIRHILKEMKNAGLVEDDSVYAGDAIDDLKIVISKTANRWYKIGARRGMLVFIDALLNGDFEIVMDKNGNRELISNVESVEWESSLNIKLGNNKKKLPKKKFQLTLSDLKFDIS